MHWPWQKSADHDAWRLAIDQKLAALDESVRAGQEFVGEQLALLEQVPRMARHVAKFSASLAELEEKRSEEAKDIRRLEETVDTTVRHLVRWVDELSAIVHQPDTGDPWREVHGTWLRQAESALEAMGYREIPVLGRAFDPKIAEAVGTVEPTDRVSPYTVVEVVRRGYWFQGQLWRRADVITARPTDASEEEG